MIYRNGCESGVFKCLVIKSVHLTSTTLFIYLSSDSYQRNEGSFHDKHRHQEITKVAVNLGMNGSKKEEEV